MQAPGVLERIYRRFCNAIYYECAWGYDLTSWLVSFGHWTSWRRLALDFLSGKNVLELGFGTGALQVDLVKQNKNVYGVELSGPMHRITSKRLRKHQLQSNRTRADGRFLPIVSHSMDHIVATFPEQYIIAKETLSECARVLKPGGSFILVGRWITMEQPILKLFFPVFYRAPTDEEQKDMERRLAEVGLSYELQSKRIGLARVYAIIARREELVD